MVNAVAVTCEHPPAYTSRERASGSTEDFMYRGVAQLVARTAGGREVAGSSPVTPTSKEDTTFIMSSTQVGLFCARGFTARI